MKKIIFIILLVLVVVPLNVNADTWYFNYGEYNYNGQEVIESNIEPVQIIQNPITEKIIYKQKNGGFNIFHIHFILL